MRLTPRHALAIAGLAAIACAPTDSLSVSAQQLDVRELAAVIPSRIFGLHAGRGLSTGCTLPEHRQFDFWVGTWDVYNPAEALAGTNTIELELDGCVVEENWNAGGRGRSINIYDAADGMWHQHWVFSGGGPASVLLLDGGSPGPNVMRMGGMRPFPGGVQLEDEITWTAFTRDSVRQHWLLSVDGGEPFTAFDGYYRRVAQVTPIPPTPSPTCSDRPANHAMDFLLGRWILSPGRGAKNGMENGAAIVTFTADLDHCLIEEHLDGPASYRGWSFSGYHPVHGAWMRTYVDNLGHRILLSGNADGDRMVLSGTKAVADGEDLLVRLTYAPAGDGRVTQRWETSGDGGTTWTTDVEVQLVRAPE